MKNIYDEQWYNACIVTLTSEIKDLETWSAYNDDVHNAYIKTLQETLEAIKEEHGKITAIT